ncbi:hypothetical protein EDB84DRAFT_1495500, partial [Lactarius hengduanensis]
SFVFLSCGAQPLCIAGVTGPIPPNQTIFKILEVETDSPDYLHFIGWPLASTVAWTYLQFGIQVLTYQFDDPSSSPAGALTSTILALLMLVTAFLFKCLLLDPCSSTGTCADSVPINGMPLALVASSAIAYWGSFHNRPPVDAPVGPAFQPSHGRSWLVRFWQLDGKWVRARGFRSGSSSGCSSFSTTRLRMSPSPFPLELSLTNLLRRGAQSLIAQGFPVPAAQACGFHYDFALLGVTTFLAGLLGVPAPNGLILRRRFTHERASRARLAPKATDNKELRDGINEQPREVPVAVVEQRVSNLAQGSLCLVLLTGHSCTDPLRRVRKSRVLLFVALQLTIVACGRVPCHHPAVDPLRALIVPRMRSPPRSLGILDRPTASSFLSGF